MTLLAHIRAAFAQSNETYGSPRMVYELREAGFTVGRRRIARLMREDGLQACIKRRFKCTTDSAHSHPVARNHLARAFTPEARNTGWATLELCRQCQAKGMAILLGIASQIPARRRIMLTDNADG